MNRAQLLKIPVCQERMRKTQHVAVRGSLIQDVSGLADETEQRHDQLFADGINRRIRNLSEKLFEIIEEQLWPV